MAAVMEEKDFRGVQSTLLVVCLILALCFSVSLFTFSHDDAAWSHSGTSSEVENLGSFVGAWVADISLSLFGFMAYSFPFMLIWQGVLFFKNRPSDRSKMASFLYAGGLFITILTGAAIFYLYVPRLFIELPHGSGGILGEVTGDAMILLIGDYPAQLFILGIFIFGMTAFTGLSWFKVMDTLGHYTCLFFINMFKGLTMDDERYNSPATNQQKATKAPSKKKAAKASKKDKYKHTQEPSYQTALPDSSLLVQRNNKKVKGYSKADLDAIAALVETVLADFNISVQVVDIHPGPVITRFELLPAPGVKVSRITGLTKDLARGLSVSRVRVVDIIHGKPVIGLEIPNKEREIVSFSDLINSKSFEEEKSPLTLALGKDIAGKPVMADLGKMPHLLVAGTTGSGKSVAINTMILSLLYKSDPKKVRLIMIDPKMLELSVYEGIPHLLTPVVTDMKEASNALRWAVGEMERRYKLMSKLGVRNLVSFNYKINEAIEAGEPILDPLFQADPLFEGKQRASELETLPNIVIVIDELADMMMIVGKKVEELIARLAQKARAAGIHLILATQRPSVDVLTGLIKANVPTRISFQVSSRIDSRTILDQSGAESLLGNGDMLYLPSGTSIPIRAHGAFVEDAEVHKVVAFLKSTAPTDYLTNILEESNVPIPGLDKMNQGGTGSETDVLYDEAVEFVISSRKASISSVQRRLKVGYNRAARMIDDMEAAGVISAPEHNGVRTVLVPAVEE
ncbi:MAG: cell division protein FtsK [Methylococcaceae bacterium]|nr:cell division protein FtsK [Methylococcaceae bacterium]